MVAYGQNLCLKATLLSVCKIDHSLSIVFIMLLAGNQAALVVNFILLSHGQWENDKCEGMGSL